MKNYKNENLKQVIINIIENAEKSFIGVDSEEEIQEYMNKIFEILMGKEDEYDLKD